MNVKPAVVLTGTAKEGKTGPSVGLVDFGMSDGAYLFRVALPGVRRNQSGNVKCNIQKDGRVEIEGEISGGGVLEESSMVYEMKVQQLCPPGPFSISFNLPGPVDPRLSSPNFRSDGILEVVIRKFRIPDTVPNGVPTS